MHSEHSQEDQVELLVEQGRYADAADAARQAGDPARAATLYERIWMFAEAAACAREAGDLGAALRHALDARDDQLATALAEELEARGEEGKRTALAVFEKRRRFASAAPLAERLGERQRAISLYQNAHMDLDAARLLEEAGRVREAGRTLERVLAHSDAPDERARAELRLGLLLAARLQHEPALRHLQNAAAHPATQQSARRAMIVELAALDLRDAARDVLLRARHDDPSLPIDLDTFVRAERERAPERAAGERDESPLVAGRFRLGPPIGAGGSGRVYRAHDEVTGREVAIKLFHGAFARDRDAYERFVREANVAQTLRHPNIVDVLHVAPEHGALVMEHMSGKSLADRLPAPLSEREAKNLALDLIAGLEAAHQRGVIHRDVKPANVFFDASGRAKLGDFGIAHLLDLGQTQTGGLIGTVAYMAPEQVTGADLTIAADLYGLGVTLFEALTGRPPFLGPDFIAQHLGEAPPAPSEVAPHVASGWDAILSRLLAKSPDERHGDLDALRRDLESLSLEEDEAKPLELPRGGRRLEAEDSARAPRRRQRRETAEARNDKDDREAGQAPAERYAFETFIRRTDNASLSRALDTALDRTVVIERYEPGGLDEATERRLLLLARGGGPFLQRALGFDRDGGVVVYEAPTGAPLDQAVAGRPLSARDAIDLVESLSLAVLPLHEFGGAHGALSSDMILLDEAGFPTVLAAGLGRAPAGAHPEDDTSAIIALIASLLGVDPSFEALARALVPAGPLPDLDPPRSGEELYRRAESLEIARVKHDLSA